MTKTYTKAMHLADLRGVKKTLMAQKREIELRLVSVQNEIDKVLPPLKLEPIVFGYRTEIGNQTFTIIKCLGGWEVEGPRIRETFAHLSLAKQRLQRIQETNL